MLFFSHRGKSRSVRRFLETVYDKWHSHDRSNWLRRIMRYSWCEIILLFQGWSYEKFWLLFVDSLVTSKRPMKTLSNHEQVTYDCFWTAYYLGFVYAYLFRIWRFRFCLGHRRSDRTRTCGLVVPNHAPYQLGYTPKVCRSVHGSHCTLSYRCFKGKTFLSTAEDTLNPPFFHTSGTCLRDSLLLRILLKRLSQSSGGDSNPTWPYIVGLSPITAGHEMWFDSVYSLSASEEPHTIANMPYARATPLISRIWRFRPICRSDVTAENV